MKRQIMNSGKKHKVIIGGGGTGGHVFPAIAIANTLMDAGSDLEILFVGADNRLEMEKVPEAGYNIIGLPIAGFQRRWTIKNLSFFYKLIVSMWRSKRIIRKFNPDVAVGVGGYASGPILKAAARKNVPILIQEQNSYAGVTNRLLAKSAKTICVAYEGMEKYFPAERIVLTGNPVRRELIRLSNDQKEYIKHFGLIPGKKVILVIGGSLGARTLNESMTAGLSGFERDDLQVIWQTGNSYYKVAENAVEQSGLDNVKVLPFIRQMDYAFGAAEVIISRAGAGTISELCLVGKPVILVPSPNVAEDHQTKNAMALVSRKAAIMVPDNFAVEHLVSKAIKLIDDHEQRVQLSQNIKQLGIPDSSERIVREILKLI